MDNILANEAIRSRRVLVIDTEGNNLGEMDTRIAFFKAKELGFDLVQVGLNAKDSLPICRFMDYGKYKYEQAKKRKNQTRSHLDQTKEIKFKLQTSEHDLETKKKKVIELIGDSYKVKFGIEMKGRQLAHQDDAKKLLKLHADSFAGIAKYDNLCVGDRLVYVTLSTV